MSEHDWESDLNCGAWCHAHNEICGLAYNHGGEHDHHFVKEDQ